jgi:hypothetical protein
VSCAALQWAVAGTAHHVLTLTGGIRKTTSWYIWVRLVAKNHHQATLALGHARHHKFVCAMVSRQLYLLVVLGLPVLLLGLGTAGAQPRLPCCCC